MGKITVTRALVQLKSLEKKINKLTNEFNPVAIVINKKIQRSNETVDEFSKRVTEDYQSLVDLIKQKNMIKSQVVVSNAITKVTIAKEEMTVAQAIERKISIGYDKMLINQLKNTMSIATDQEMNTNSKVQTRLDNLLESTFSKDSTKVKKEEYDAVAGPFMERNEASVLDPIKVRKEIEKKTEIVENFEKEVDVILSEINATTYIEN
jgi:hypothetical protein